MGSTLYMYANLFNVKFYTVEKFTIGHVAASVAHGALRSISSAYAYAHAQLRALGRTCTSWLM